MTTDENCSWFPLFEFQNWTYDSFLVLPTSEANSAIAWSPTTARKWAKGTFECGQAFDGPHGYSLGGTLVFDLPPAPRGPNCRLRCWVRSYRGFARNFQRNCHRDGRDYKRHGL